MALSAKLLTTMAAMLLACCGILVHLLQSVLAAAAGIKFKLRAWLTSRAGLGASDAHALRLLMSLQPVLGLFGCFLVNHNIAKPSLSK